jgi:hypothetical protein
MADEEQKKGRELVPEEIKEMRYGMDLEEMCNTAGWKIFETWLADRAFHTWVDPRETDSKEAWEWRELNAFHSADVSKQLLDDISKAITRAHYLHDIQTGEVVEGKRMKI